MPDVEPARISGVSVRSACARWVSISRSACCESLDTTPPRAALARADLNDGFPVRAGVYDAVLSSLVSEHLTDLDTFFAEAFGALREGGRLVFSAFHPDPARAGVEANFERDGTEYRVGAQPYTVEEYFGRIADAGFERVAWHEYRGDDRLREEIPHASKYVGRPLLLLVCAERGGAQPIETAK